MPALLGAATYAGLRYAATGVYTNGLWVEGASSALSIVASIQELNGRDMQQLSEGQRTTAIRKLYTETELHTVQSNRSADRITYEGRSLEVQEVENWNAHTTGLPHYRYVLAEPGWDEAAGFSRAPTDQEVLLYAWINYALTTADATAQVIYGFQDSPRPARPYATLDVLGNEERNITPQLEVTDTASTAPSTKYVYELTEHRIGTVSVAIYADAAPDLVRALSRSIYLPETELALWNNDPSLPSVQIIGNIIGGTTDYVQRQVEQEKWVVADYEFVWKEITEGNVDVIETVLVTPSYT